MNPLLIASINFNLIEIDNDKLLLQVTNNQIKQSTSIPLIAEHINNSQLKQIHNVVAAENEILIYYKKESFTELLNELQKFSNSKIIPDKESFKIEVCFEFGEDWEAVCNHTKKKREQIISELLKCKFPLINYGFQPGFMYLDDLDESLSVPRRSTPRLKVPAGTLAIGGKYVGIYGSESPGGWNIIGRSSHKIIDNFEIEHFPSIGQKIEFIQIGKQSYLRKYGK